MNVKSLSPEEKELYYRVYMLRKNATPSELKFKQLLDDAKIEYVFQKPLLTTYKYYIVDFWFKKHLLIIEIDGSVHNNLDQVKKDIFKDKYITEKRGFRIIRLTNEQVNNMSVEDVKKIVREG
jgi:cyclase